MSARSMKPHEESASGDSESRDPRPGRSPKPRRNLVLAALALGSLVLASASAEAQYNLPGSSQPSGDIPPKEDFEERIEEARWRFGGLRIQPWLGIRDAAWVTLENNETGVEEDDFTLTVGAGLRGYLPVAGKSYWTFQALPEYVWWSDLEDRRRTNGRYGIGYFGYFNNLRVELSHRIDESQGFFSNEIRQLISLSDQTSRLALELDLGSRFQLVGRFTLQELENQIEEESLFSRLDRDEDRGLVEVRYKAARGWTVGLGFEDRSTDFVGSGRNLDNSADGGRLFVSAEGNRVQGLLQVSVLSFEPDAGSAFPEVDETVGELAVVWNLSSQIDMLTYSRRGLSYALDPASAYYLGDRTGVRLVFGSRQVRVGLVAEFGQDDYEPLFAGPARSDDVTELGISLDFPVGRFLAVGFDLNQTEYDSNIATFDRDVLDFGFRVELGRLLERLRLGSDDNAW